MFQEKTMLGRFIRLIGSGAVIVVLLGQVGTAVALPDSLQPVNLALRRPARQSSAQPGGHASRAVDGNAGLARWWTPGTAP